MVMSKDVTERKKAEEALKASKAYLVDNILNSVGDPIFVKDDRSRFVLFNDALPKILGIKRENIIGKTLGESLPKDQMKHFLKIDKMVLKSGQENLCEEQLTGKEGKILTIVTKKTRYVDKQGNKFLVGVIRDITERKKAEEELITEKNKCTSLTENSDDIIMIVNREGIIQYINKTLPPYSQEESTGRPVYEYVPEEQRNIMMNSLSKVFKTGKPDSYEISSNIPKIGIIWFSTKVVPIKSNKGAPCAILIATNITERKKAEEEIHNNQAQLSNALNIAHLGSWEYDVLKDTFTFNDNFYAIFRTTAEKEGGYKMSSREYAKRFVHPEDAPLVGIETKKAIETKDPNFNRQLEHRIIYADGKEGYITVRFFIVKDAKGRTVRTYGVNQDITERKKAEEELRKRAEALEKFNKLGVDRELKMIELKKKIKELESKIKKMEG